MKYNKFEEVFNIKDKRYTVGDLAKATGLTIRTLQHYDNIGLLPASGRSENGRRYYIEEDIIKLEQIIFYKGLGFSLQQIQERAVNTTNLKEMDELLSHQANFLYTQTESIHTSIAAIEACREVIKAKKNPPWEFLSIFISKLYSSDFLTWDITSIVDQQQETLNQKYSNLDEVMGFFHSWKTLSIKAAIFHRAGIKPSEGIAQEIAKEWLEMAQSATGGNQELLEVYLKVDEKRELWPEGARALMEAAETFIDEAFKIYCNINNIDIPW